MESFMNSDLAITIVGAVLALLSATIVVVLTKLIKDIKDSENKLDDEALPLLESIRDAVEEAKKDK